ncbi:regulator of G-protein signaling 22 isoform X3 [Denticeps clupeoides]|uniref:regulator of G-protein signaling 22 isoform X3 n=1 Tax=Denticeps clupeoides TaxID=299321 RepID=UPI0010A58894|nr:regulator of G-protein signaling 22 isoform X3 [Denticeps clupeoides]
MATMKPPGPTHDMLGQVDTDLPEITSDNFDDHLFSDRLFAEFFNEFLRQPVSVVASSLVAAWMSLVAAWMSLRAPQRSPYPVLQAFPEAVRFDQETGAFEVVTGAEDTLQRQIRAATPGPHNSYTVEVRGRKRTGSPCPHCPQTPLTEGVTGSRHPPQTPGPHNSYTVECLDREQGLLWARKTRLHLFLQSDCYFEYRLAKRLSQLGYLGRWKEGVLNQTSKQRSMSPDQKETLLFEGQEESGSFQWSINESEEHSSGAAREVETQGPESAGEARNARNAHNPTDGAQGKRRGEGGERSAQPGLDDFKGFLSGTPGGKAFNLWMDIERLKALQSTESKNRHLFKSRSHHLKSGGRGALNAEILSRLDLATPTCWRDEKLRLVQPRLTKVLLMYWGPRFFASQSACGKKVLSRLQLPCSGADPWPRPVTELPLRPTSRVPRTPTSSEKRPVAGSGGPVLGGGRMERMLQALHVEPRAGFFFRRFCEQSGNKVLDTGLHESRTSRSACQGPSLSACVSQLWENALRFWTDLQDYHELFCQRGLDPYRAERTAQVLYSSYLSSTAQRSIGVVEGCRTYVLSHLSPAFEDLFDWPEEHALTLLLEPWTLLTNQDRGAFERVDLWEDTRHIKTPQYKKRLALHAEHVQRTEKQVEECRLPPTQAEGSREPDLWTQVPEEFRGFRLGTLLQNRLELEHFLVFLEQNFTSTDLLCWLDLEQLRRTSHGDQTLRAERVRNVRSKYLNRKYFFGPTSPATKLQQEEVVSLAGGWTQLSRQGLSGAALAETQDSPQVQDVAEDNVVLRRHKKRPVWKHVDGALMASSQEVLAFRQALQNPVTCLQFRRFVALKGDSLENNVLFWLEVQRYKDLCHSHCDEATVQQKISTIISCFIDSSVPPALQIDIPPEQAQQILEKRWELGPYVFKEAQITVFTELYKLWPEFLSFRSSMKENQVLMVLERERVRLKTWDQQQRKEEEEKEEQRRTEEALRSQRGTLSALFEEDGWGGEEQIDAPHLLSWTYSKYLAALEREALLAHRQAQKKPAGESVRTGAATLPVQSQISGVRRRVANKCHQAVPLSRAQRSAMTSGSSPTFAAVRGCRHEQI